MLRTFRENIKGTFGKILLALIVIPFVGFGAADLITGRGDARTVMNINGVEIDELQFARELSLTRNELASRMGADVDYSALSEDKIAPIVKQRFIQSTLMEQLSDSLNMAVPEAMLEQAIVGMEEFKLDGKFSNDQMQMLLASSGLNLNVLKDRLTVQMRDNQLSSGIGLSGFVSEKEVELIAQVANEARIVDWTRLDLNDFRQGLTISEDEIVAYYNARSDDFQTEFALDADYLSLGIDDFREDVSEEQVAQEYAAREQQFESAETREVAHILLELNEEQTEAAARAKFDAIKARLTSGESFAELAREYSQDSGSAADGGELGETERDGTFPEAFENALFELEAGEVSEPVLTDAGLHLIKAVSVQRSEMPGLAELRMEIIDQLQRSGAEKRYLLAKEELADLVFNADGLAEPAASLQLNLSTAKSLTRSGASLDETSVIDSDLFTDVVLQALYSDELLEQGLNSELIELSNDRSIVVAVSATHPPRTRELAEVREQIENLLRDKRAADSMSAEAQALVQQVEQGLAFADVLQETGRELNENTRLERQTAELEAGVIESVFSAARNSVGEIVHTVRDSQGNIYLYRLARIQDGRDNTSDELSRLISQQAQLVVARQELTALLENLKHNAVIEEP